MPVQDIILPVFLAVLRRHTQTVHEKLRPHACGDCSVVFLEAEKLRRRTKSVREKQRPHTCAACATLRLCFMLAPRPASAPAAAAAALSTTSPATSLLGKKYSC